jgi:signal transduction histidine kinase
MRSPSPPPAPAGRPTGFGAASPPFPIILGIATLLGVFSTLLAYSFQLSTSEAKWWVLFALNISYWYVWALMAPAIFRLTRRFRFDRNAWRPAVAVHLPAAAITALLHVMSTGVAQGLVRGTLEWDWWLGYVRRTYWMSVDWEMMTYWTIVGVSHALHYHSVVRQRELAAAHLEARLAEARLQGLQRQLHPHFLFNTLHGISALMHIDLAAADRMIALLGDLLRSSLQITAQEIPLKDELELLGKYLDIERLRFRQRLTVSYDVSAETLDALVPSLILQPLVENALDHGIAPSSAGGRLDIRARRDGNRLFLEVVDDGVGLREDALTAIQKGIGVSNTRSRLQCLYGAAQRFEFCRTGPRGLTVRVVIPWRDAAPTPQPKTVEWVS